MRLKQVNRGVEVNGFWIPKKGSKLLIISGINSKNDKFKPTELIKNSQNEYSL
jgi:hypothetical protein